MGIVDIIQVNPRTSLVVISFVVTLFITIVNYFMTDREKMKEIRERQKSIRKELKQHRNNPEKMMELNKKSMEDSLEQMKHSWKPMIVTMIPLLIFFSWLRSTFAETAIASSWFWWYLGASLIFSITLRKMVGLQ